MRIRFAQIFVVLAIGAAVSPLAAVGNTYYVAPSATPGTPDGTIDHPWTSFATAITAAGAGDTIYARGGTYNLTSKVAIGKSGGVNNPINLINYPNETPILDFSAMVDADSNRGVEMNDSANWWYLKGLTIQHAGDNGLNSKGDNGRFEQIVTRYNRDSGFQLDGTATNNLVLNCDSYENYDAPKKGEDADGFAVKFEDLGPGNIIRGSRAWGNSDDGWDMWMGNNGVLLDNCWSFKNGINIWGVTGFNGDGNGYKLGHDGAPDILVNVLAWGNRANGVDVNGNGYNYDANDNPTTPNGSHVEVYNSTSYNNTGTNWVFDENVAHILRNNISLKTSGGGIATINGPVDDTFNTWNGIQVDANDFISLVDTIAAGPRNADGSLPISDFLRLVSNSNLINAGTPISYTFNGVTYNIAFNGSLPDLGAFETAPPAPALPGDYNGDNTVDAADYAVWRDATGTSTVLPNDATPGTVDATDYDVWQAHFGQTAGSGSTLLSGTTGTTVPEPSGVVLIAIATVMLRFLLARR